MGAGWMGASDRNGGWRRAFNWLRRFGRPFIDEPRQDDLSELDDLKQHAAALGEELEMVRRRIEELKSASTES